MVQYLAPQRTHAALDLNPHTLHRERAMQVDLGASTDVYDGPVVDEHSALITCCNVRFSLVLLRISWRERFFFFPLLRTPTAAVTINSELYMVLMMRQNKLTHCNTKINRTYFDHHYFQYIHHYLLLPVRPSLNLLSAPE